MDLLPYSLWHPTDFYLTCNSSSFLYLIAFSLFSISCIVIATVSSGPRHANRSCQTCNIYPMSAPPVEELNAVTQFIHFYSTSYRSSASCHTEPDIENQDHPKQDQQVPDTLQLAKLEHTLSKVTLTFGSDKPEVYMKMAQQSQKRFLCRCPCNHQSPELAPFPHASNTSTISSDLSVQHHMDDGDSLSSVASNKQPISMEPDAHMSTEIHASCSNACSKAEIVNGVATFDMPRSGWIIIHDGEKNGTVEEPTSKQVAVRKDLICGLEYTKLKTMVPFIDPAIFIQWFALKIMVSLYILAKRLYDCAVDNAVVRMFQE